MLNQKVSIMYFLQMVHLIKVSCLNKSANYRYVSTSIDGLEKLITLFQPGCYVNRPMKIIKMKNNFAER